MRLSGDMGSIPGLGRLPGVGNGNTLQYSCLEKPMDRGAWWATDDQGQKESDPTEWPNKHIVLVMCWVCLCAFCIINPFKTLQQPSEISIQFSRSVVSDSLQPHGLCHARLPCPSPTPRADSKSCPLSQWCHPTLSSSVVPLLIPPSILPRFRASSNESTLHIRWPK